MNEHAFESNEIPMKPVSSLKTVDGMEVNLVARSRNGDTILESQVVRLKNGELFCTWTTGHHYEPHVKVHTRCARSYDDGRTWVEEKILFQHPYRGVYTPTLYQDEDGSLYAFLCICGHRESRDVLRYFHVMVSRGDEQARNWSAPRGFLGGTDALEVKQVFRRGNRLYLAAFSADRINDKWADPDLVWDKECIVNGRVFSAAELDSLGCSMTRTVSIYYSDDNLRSLHRGTLLSHFEHPFGFAEPAVTELSDGSYIMLLRTEEPHIYASRSRNLVEWSPPEILPGVPTPALGAKVRLLRDRRGYIYLFLKNGSVNRTAPLSCWVSCDDMKSWAAKLDLAWDDTPRNISYPSPFLDEEKKLLCFSFDNHVTEVYYATLPLQAFGI